MLVLQTLSVEISNVTRPGVVSDAKADVLPERLPSCLEFVVVVVVVVILVVTAAVVVVVVVVKVV